MSMGLLDRVFGREHEVGWVQRGFAVPDFVVHMDAGGSSCTAHVAKNLSTHDHLPLFHDGLFHVAKFRFIAIAMIDDHVVSKIFAVLDEANYPVGCCLNGCPAVV